MSITTFASREFSRGASRAKRAAKRGSVFVTDHEAPAHVLLTIEDFRKLAGENLTLAEALAQPEAADFDFAPMGVPIINPREGRTV